MNDLNSDNIHPDARAHEDEVEASSGALAQSVPAYQCLFGPWRL